MLKTLLTEAAVFASLAVPVAAQTVDPQPQAQFIYGHPVYGYDENELRASIGQSLGNQYSLPDRTAVHWCASAAIQQAAVKYWPRTYGNSHDCGHQGIVHEGFDTAALMRVTAIDGVKRLKNGVQVSGLIDSRSGYPKHTLAGSFSFRCSVDYGGIVSKVRVSRTNT